MLILYFTSFQSRGEHPVTETEAKALGTKINAVYMETSSKTRKQLKDAFDAAILAGLPVIQNKRPLWKKLFCISQDFETENSIALKQLRWSRELSDNKRTVVLPAKVTNVAIGPSYVCNAFVKYSIGLLRRPLLAIRTLKCNLTQ